MHIEIQSNGSFFCPVCGSRRARRPDRDLRPIFWPARWLRCVINLKIA